MLILGHRAAIWTAGVLAGNTCRFSIVKEVRKIPGVVRADALFGLPDIVALVEGDDIASMDAVIDRIVELDGVIDTESKVLRSV